MANLQRVAGWRLWSLGGPAGWQQQSRQRLLEHLRRQGWQPETLTLREEDGAQPFDADTALRSMQGPWPGGLFLQGPRFDVWLDLGRRSALELRCQGGSLAEIAAWADGLFSDLPPDFAWLVPWHLDAPAGFERTLHELQAATGPGRDVQANGPGGPGLVSWFGPGVAPGLRDAVSGLNELRLVPGDGPVLRFDLAGPVQANIEDRLRRWPAARDACLASGWFARCTRDATGSESWQRAQHWPAPPSPARVAIPPERPAAAERTDGPAAQPPASAGAAELLAAAARNGTQISGLKLGGIKAVAADWRYLHAYDLDLQDADLREARFIGATLVDCDFDRALLGRANLEGANLDQARLREVLAPQLSLAGATLTHCFLQRAVLTEIDCGGALLQACHAVAIDAERADFEGALLEHVDFSGAKLRGARFVRAVLRGCCLDRADLRDIDWTDAVLEDCSRKGALE